MSIEAYFESSTARYWNGQCARDRQRIPVVICA